MAETEIPPLWLHAEDRPRRALQGAPLGGSPGGASRRRFRLPLLLRLRALREGLPLVLAARDAPAGRLTLSIRDRAGIERGREALPPTGPWVVHLPPGGTALEIEAEGDLSRLALGYYPIHKVALKLHAFANGDFAAQGAAGGIGPRWTAAGVAARTLRGSLKARISASPARRAGEAARYRAFRALHVEDFTAVPPPKAAPRLSLISDATGTSPEALMRCANALAEQTDQMFEWVVALPPARMMPEGATIATAGARLVPTTSPNPADRLASALAKAEGGLVAFLDPAGRPTRDAVALIRDAFARHPDCALAYADEERLDMAGAPLYGVFHPAFNRHLMEASGYLCAFAALPRADALALGLRAEAGAAALYDLLLRQTAQVEPSRIRHMPRVAYGIEVRPPGFPPEAVERAAAALSQVAGVPVDVVAGGRHLRPLYEVPEGEPLVSIVVPTRDRAELLGTTLRSLIEKTRYRGFEIIVVDNGSVEEATFALFDEVKALWPRTSIVRDDGAFNFPRICNRGVEAAQGDLILLLNNDMEIKDGGWLTEMVALASLPGAGVVGAKLLFPNGTIQHAGTIVGLFRYADHWFAHSAADAPGYEDRLLVRQNLSAVTAACLLIRRDVWDEIGPLDAERFAEDCNDVDLCLRARRAGYEVVFTPFAELLHYESASRGKKRSKAHRERLKAQRARMEAIWHNASLVDPHYNPNLDRKSLFAALAPAPDGDRAPRTDAI